MIDRQLARSLVVSVGSVVAIVGSFLPWLRSGAVDRSSYELFGLVDRLGFAPDGLIGWALRLWPLVPLLFVLAAVVQFLPGALPAIRIVRWLIAVAAAGYASAVVVALRFAPESGLFGLRFGAVVTAVGAALVAIGAVAPSVLAAFRPR